MTKELTFKKLNKINEVDSKNFIIITSYDMSNNFRISYLLNENLKLNRDAICKLYYRKMNISNMWNELEIIENKNISYIFVINIIESTKNSFNCKKLNKIFNEGLNDYTKIFWYSSKLLNLTDLIIINIFEIERLLLRNKEFIIILQLNPYFLEEIKNLFSLNSIDLIPEP